MQLTQLEYFISVARNLSFTKASEQLHISQSAVSQQISRLEEELGFFLFVRKNKGIALTEQGKILLEGSVKALELLKETVETASESCRKTRHQLNIGYVDELNVHLFFPSLIHQFEDKYTNVDISAKRYNFTDLQSGIKDKNIDLGFSLAFTLDESSGLIRRTLIKENTYIAVSQYSKIHFSKDKPLTDRLRDKPLIMISKKESPKGYAHSLSILKEQFDFEPVSVIEVQNLETQFLYTASDIGFTLLDPLHISFNSSQLRVYPLSETPEDKLAAVWSPFNKNAALKWFVSIMEDAFRI